MPEGESANPDQLELFEVDRPDPDDLATRAAEGGLAAAALRHTPDRPDPTDRWLDETGGGGRRDTLAANHPQLPRPQPSKRPSDPENPYGLPHERDYAPPINEVGHSKAPEDIAKQHAGRETARTNKRQ